MGMIPLLGCGNASFLPPFLPSIASLACLAVDASGSLSILSYDRPLRSYPGGHCL